LRSVRSRSFRGVNNRLLMTRPLCGARPRLALASAEVREREYHAGRIDARRGFHPGDR
jgi:hypothetical protein